ncbi:hypothetical protein [Methanococcus aeolicus]|uniref:hypothetical protein n=1 Tax=Methanococcus aeolicus TaxID=42879 RepID=UPI0021C7356C|nr:hypothetical protein [Methanococcus aeolicus]UXM85430.1 hypothetical protein N6C89_03925 [Methanococcus aeolicus]
MSITDYSIEDVINILKDIDKNNLVKTEHFISQHNERVPELDIIDDFILKKEFSGILKQDVAKFKLYYEIDEKYDLIILIDIKSTNPEVKINLITCIKQSSKRRVRKDEKS